jgi:hypothetical protein
MLVHLGATHIVNIHLLSNLEPFRWGDPEYIQKADWYSRASFLSFALLGVAGHGR